jgi:UDP-N-acetylmuramate: L-alanyl-gamma-D-glutamyl-meso-diaminopimelate ligase
LKTPNGPQAASARQSSANRIPGRVADIHLIAICGTGMAALAAMLKDLGFNVTGSDHDVYPPMSTFLAQKGIAVRSGFDTANLDPAPDLVVVGNAVTRDNAEAAAVLRRQIPYCSMPQALNHFVAAGKKPLVVTGTHGKTTTASLLAWVLCEAACDPSFFIGGILQNFDSNYRLGKGPYIVFEGDEYDTAFFDKGPKFLHYKPYRAVLTGIEFDHGDIYRDLAHVQQAFSAFVTGMPPNSALVAFDGPGSAAEAVLRNAPTRVIRYGQQPGDDWRLVEAKVAPPRSRFRIERPDGSGSAFETRLMGTHNLLNAVAVVAVAAELGLDEETVRRALASFAGIRRRQEVRGRRRGVTVIDDFAHHPTAVRETIRAVRPFYPEGRLIAVFEPCTNTSMRRTFQQAYAQVFDAADIVCIREPSRLAKVPPAERLSARRLVADLEARGLRARHFENTDVLIDYLAAEARSGDTILIMSNGGFDNIHARLLAAL